MNLASLVAPLNKTNLLTNIDPTLQSLSRSQQESKGGKSETPNILSSISGMNSLFKNREEAKFPVLIEDSDDVIIEPTKKLKTDENNINSNMAPNSNVKDQSGQKKQNSQQQRKNEGSNNLERSWPEDHRSSKDSNESMSTINSNSSMTEPSTKKEIIELEDSPQEEDPREGFNLPPDNLVMTDDVISGLSKDKEKLAHQYQLLLRNGVNPTPEPSFQMQATEQAQQAWAQVMQMNQLYQSLQRSGLSQLGAGLPFYNMNAAMALPLMYNMKNNLLRQAQAQNQSSLFGNDLSSLLGKRNSPYEDLENLLQRNLQNLQRAALNNQTSQGQSEIIILDDEEEQQQEVQVQKPKQMQPLQQKIKIPMVPITPVAEKKEERYILTAGFLEKIKDKNFKAFSIIKRPYWKKPVFKILTQRRRSRPSQFYEYIGRAPYGSIKIGARERSALGLTKEMINLALSGDTPDDGGRRRSTRLRGEKLMEKKEFIDASGFRRVEEINQASPYHINIHVNEDDPEEEIMETPIGDDFQGSLPPFSISSEMFRPVKAVWNPEMMEDNEDLTNYYKYIAKKFEKEVVNEEVALKTLRKFDMDISKVEEEIEENKMTYRSFFEVKQKVPKSRLHL